MDDFIRIRGAREHNLKGDRRRHPAPPAGGDHRPVGLGQVQPRLRHDLRRGPAALRREPVGLCAAVPGADAEAGRRPDHRPVAGDLDRAEDHLEEPALDGRHGHRDLRLHAPALGARRHPLFARDRPADRGADRLADGRPGARHARGHAGSTCWRRSCAGARASTARSSPTCCARASSGSRSTASCTISTRSPALDKKRKHEIEVVVDRVVTAPDLAQRLAESRSRPRSGLADGLVIAENADTGERLTMSAKFACPVSGFTLPEIEPRLFSFNNPYGACPACDGLGKKMLMDPELIVPGPRQVGRQGCGRALVVHDHELVSADAGLDLQALSAPARTRPGHELPAKVRERHPLRLGRRAGADRARGRAAAASRPGSRSRAWSTTCSGAGARPSRAWMREELSRYMSSTTCEACGGYRLKPEALCGQDRRPAHRRGHRAVDPRRGRLVRGPAGAADAPSSRRSPPACSRRSASGWASSTRSGSAI